MNIEKLTDLHKPFIRDNERVLAMVGSYAPAHEGHVDAMDSAIEAYGDGHGSIAAGVFVPNSDAYVVEIKLKGTGDTWTLDKRVSSFSRLDTDTDRRMYVDDITGYRHTGESISRSAIHTLVKKIGVKVTNAVLVVGSDQLLSMEPYIETNDVVCVMRSGFELQSLRAKDGWINKALDDRRLIMTKHKKGGHLNSSDIRRLGEIYD